MSLQPWIACFGECMIELRGQAFGALTQSFGGDTLNTAIYLSRLAPHLRTSYATALGADDDFSRGMLAAWQDEGIDNSLVQCLPGRLPGLYAISLDERGERRFAYWREQAAARAYFEAALTPLEAALNAGLGVLYFSGISLAILPPAGRERLLAVAARLRAAGGRVVFDNNYRPRLWPDASVARAAFDAALGHTDIALLTLDDEQALRGLPDAASTMTYCLELPVPEVVVKQGQADTRVRVAGECLLSVPVERVAQVVDTTAAGDSFAAGYLACRLSGGDAAEAAQLGNRLAARVIQYPGAIIPRAAMPADGVRQAYVGAASHE